MTVKDLLTLRLANQQVCSHSFIKPKDIVAWMGAMQAQDYAMARWAVGLRLAAPDNKAVQKTIDEGGIIRTHLLRPTWHFVSSENAGWILDLTAPHIQASMKPRLKELELTSRVLSKTLNLMDRLLRDGAHLTRDDIIAVLERNKIATRDQRSSYLLMWAELEKIICSGALKGMKNTYAHFALRVKEQKSLSRDEGLYRIAQRYFTSHGPATLIDFANWSGLPMSDAKKALKSAEDILTSEKIDSKTYWFREQPVDESAFNKVYFLPAFDEFVIGYKDRSACLFDKDKAEVISKNGMFFPIVVFRGKVVGSWRKSKAKNEVRITHKLFAEAPSNRNFNARLKRGAADACAFFSEPSREGCAP